MKRKRDGHFHLSMAPVYRSLGQSAVAAAAYNANQRLTQRQAKLCTVAIDGNIDHRKALNKGIVTDALRQELQKSDLLVTDLAYWDELAAGQIPETLMAALREAGEDLSERLQLWQSHDGFTLRDKEHRQNYHLYANEGRLVISRHNGVALSAQATAQKGKKRHWTIRDNDRCYAVRQYDERVYDKQTKKMVVTGRYLDIYGDKTFNYRDKGDVVETWVRDTAHAPDFIKALAAKNNPDDPITEAERQALWQIAEDNEATRDGRPALKFELAFLRELTYKQNKQAVNAFLDRHFVCRDIIADVAVHRITASDGKLNEHAHILCFTREALPGGTFAPKKNKYWESMKRVNEWRAGWETVLNEALEEAGVNDVRVSKDSYKKRGMDQVAGEHMRPERWAMETEKGVATERGNRNRTISHDNCVHETAQSINHAGLNPWDAEHEASVAVPEDSPPLPSETPISLPALDVQHQRDIVTFAKTVLDRTVQANLNMVTRLRNTAHRVNGWRRTATKADSEREEAGR